MSGLERELIIFLRAPELGKVKTRLAKGLGERKALGIYLELIKLTLDVCEKVDATRSLYFFPHIDNDIVRSPFDAYVQKGSDLGQKMSVAFEEAFSRSKRVIILGTDCPYINPTLVEQAFEHLAEHDLVIGPAEDGGYYLLGMNQLQPALFTNMPWSSDKVGSLTLQRAADLRLTTLQLPVLSDVDHKEDWDSYQRSILSNRGL